MSPHGPRGGGDANARRSKRIGEGNFNGFYYVTEPWFNVEPAAESLSPGLTAEVPQVEANLCIGSQFDGDLWFEETILHGDDQPPAAKADDLAQTS